MKPTRLKKLEFKVLQEQTGQRIDVALTAWLTVELKREVSKAKARSLIVAGAVYLNGKRMRIASKLLINGARVGLFLDEQKLFSKATDQEKVVAFEFTSDLILYEDEWLMVVNKPAGLPTQPTLDEARINLFQAVKKFLAKREGIADVYLALHHRLDRDTSGVILFAKSRDANAGVAKLFSEHLAQKTYMAWVVLNNEKALPDSVWQINNYLSRDHSKKGKMRSVRSGGDVAITDFKILKAFCSERLALVQAQPKTGRMHQIRVHLSEAGTPILGDGMYGVTHSSVRMQLHACRLEFKHPMTRKKLCIDAALPTDWFQVKAPLA